MGKTWLAREVLRRAEASGERTRWIVGTDSAQALPLGAFIGVMTEAMNEAQSDPLTDVRRVINSFVAQQRQRRVLVGIDDAHLLDGLSALVVHQLAQSGGVRLVVTVRSGSDEPDAVTALWKDGLLERLDLKPFSAAETREVIESKLDGPVDARSATPVPEADRWQRAVPAAAGGRSGGRRDGCVKRPGCGCGTATLRSRRACPTRWAVRWVDSAREMALVVDTLSQCEPLAVEVLCDLARPPATWRPPSGWGW